MYNCIIICRRSSRDNDLTEIKDGDYAIMNNYRPLFTATNPAEENDTELNELYRAIGKKYAEKFSSGTFDSDFAELMGKVKARKAALAPAPTPRPSPVRTNDDQTMRYCPECGRQIKAQALFCKYCGHALKPLGTPVSSVPETTPVPVQEQPVPETTADTLGPDEKRCPKCGKVLPKMAMFCAECGTRLDGVPAAQETEPEAKQAEDEAVPTLELRENSDVVVEGEDKTAASIRDELKVSSEILRESIMNTASALAAPEEKEVAPVDMTLTNVPVDDEPTDEMPELKLDDFSTNGDHAEFQAAAEELMAEASRATEEQHFAIDPNVTRQDRLCPECGEKVPEKALFCPNCGRKL